MAAAAGVVFRDARASQNTGLAVVPVTFQEAAAFVAALHRHHGPPPGMKFALGVAERDQLVGVAMVGRPVARHFDDGLTLEVTRTCTDGSRNANSLLYGAAWRAARALGYRRLVTYTQGDESGVSLRAAGWRLAAERAPRKGWDRPSRRRADRGVDDVPRRLWEAS